MPRKSRGRAFRARIFHAAGGLCHICEGPIQATEAWDIEHRTPIAMGGADDESNMAPAHRKGCHAGKSKDDAGKLAKAKRREARHRGFVAPKRPIQSAGFVKARPQGSATRPLSKPLPSRRPIYGATAQ